ncbi:MAG: hypothetical protein CL679_04615 [Bermanella sp.]|nr:hypothetical protein [Bermanella sp.]|tara:strand:+ start:131 stop:631 length:501 start_codon:yes stop_codon:yes gene_type:complete
MSSHLSDDFFAMNKTSMKACVQTLALAKSQQDIPSALNIYHQDATLITVGLNVQAVGRPAIENQLTLFFTLFPDYQIDITQIACNENWLLATGVVQLTPTIAGHNQKTIKQSAALGFQFKDGLIYHEDFYLDFGQVCKQANLSIEQMQTAIKQLANNMTPKETDNA